jgi:hypothetical protein
MRRTATRRVRARCARALARHRRLTRAADGGQGANAGLQDGWALGWRLALASSSVAAATAALLNGYGAERRPVWAAVVALADALKRLSGSPHPAGVAEAASRALWRLLPASAQRWLLTERMAHTRFVYDWPLARDARPRLRRSGARAGALLPPAWVAHRGELLSLQQALWPPDAAGGFRLLMVAPGRGARAAGVHWGESGRSLAAAAAALLLAAAVCSGALARVAAAALCVLAAEAVRMLIRGTACRPPPPPRWAAYCALTDRLGRAPAMRCCGCRAAVLLQEGHLAAPADADSLLQLVDVEGAAADALGCGGGGEAMLLLRPDGHILLLAAAAEWQPLGAYLPTLSASPVPE